MRLFICQTLASRRISNTLIWSLLKWLPSCLLHTKAYLINRAGLVQASRGFWKCTRGQPSLVRSSETQGRGTFRFGHFEASNPDGTKGRGLLRRQGGAGAQESSGWVLGEISLTCSMHLPLGRAQASKSQGPSSLQGNRYTSGISENKTK